MGRERLGAHRAGCLGPGAVAQLVADLGGGVRGRGAAMVARRCAGACGERNEEFEPAGRLDAEAGWRLGAFGGRGLMTPFAGLALSEARNRTWRTGVRWALGPGHLVRARGREARGCQRRCARARDRVQADGAFLSAGPRHDAGVWRMTPVPATPAVRTARAGRRGRPAGGLRPGVFPPDRGVPPSDVDCRRGGAWRIGHPDGSVEEGRYVAGGLHGERTLRNPVGEIVARESWCHGRASGPRNAVCE